MTRTILTILINSDLISIHWHTVPSSDTEKKLSSPEGKSFHQCTWMTYYQIRVIYITKNMDKLYSSNNFYRGLFALDCKIVQYSQTLLCFNKKLKLISKTILEPTNNTFLFVFNLKKFTEHFNNFYNLKRDNWNPDFIISSRKRDLLLSLYYKNTMGKCEMYVV